MPIQGVNDQSIRTSTLLLNMFCYPIHIFKTLIVVNNYSTNNHLVPNPIRDVFRLLIGIYINMTKSELVLRDQVRGLFGKDSWQHLYICKTKLVQ